MCWGVEVGDRVRVDSENNNFKTSADFAVATVSATRRTSLGCDSGNFALNLITFLTYISWVFLLFYLHVIPSRV